jgi:hypothetical protein
LSGAFLVDWILEVYLGISKGLGAIVGVLTFVACWIYCISEYGFLLGVGLGWLPAMICAYLAFFLTIVFGVPALMIVTLWLLASGS